MAGGKPEPPASASREGNLKPGKLNRNPPLLSWAASPSAVPTPPPNPPAPGQPLVPRTPAEAASGRKAAMEKHRSHLCSLALLPNPPMRGST